MPGPKAINRTKGRPPSPNTPNTKTRVRLARRVAAFAPSAGFTKPGSQNRNK